MDQKDQIAFERLFRLHHKELTNLAYNLVRDKDAAKDIVQEVFFRLWKNKDNVEFGDQIKHYLFKATSHTALNHLRSGKKKTSMDEIMSENLAAAATSDEYSYKELESRVREAIDRLPPKCKMIYLLSRHEGLKYQQIADTLDLSLKTVENQMGIALEKLRTELKPFLSIEIITLIAALLASVLLFS